MTTNDKKGEEEGTKIKKGNEIKDETHKDQEKIKNESIKINDKTHKEKNEIKLIRNEI